MKTPWIILPLLGGDFSGLFRAVVTNFYTRLYSCEKFKSDFMPKEYSDKDITRLDYFSISVFMWAVVMETIKLLEEDGVEIDMNHEYQKYIIQFYLDDPIGRTDEEIFELINPDVIYLMLFMFQEEKFFKDIGLFVRETYNSGEFSSSGSDQMRRLYSNTKNFVSNKATDIQTEYDNWGGGDTWWRDIIKKIEFY